MVKAKRGAPVTPAEHQVLEILWELGAGTVAAVHAAFPRRRRVSYNTVLTQVRLLHAKGYLDREQLGRAHVYRPRVSPEETLRRVVRHFVDQFFDGDASALATFVAQSGLLARPGALEPATARSGGAGHDAPATARPPEAPPSPEADAGPA